MTHEEYLADRRQLDALNKKIDDAPMSAKPVFKGIVELAKRVQQYERDNPELIRH